ncbi:MAG: RIO1 family regulatory kinase/ATPase domain-containing protein [Candidatus Hodarchaeales archaeon]
MTVADAKRQLLATGKVKRVHAVIGGGKEATVLLAENVSGELLCAKVFRYFTSTIKKRLQGTAHILASDMAMLAAKQEYWNLFEMVKYIPVPKPIDLVENIILMEFISDGFSLSMTPAPLIRDIDLTPFNPEEILYTSIDILAQIFLEARMIHGDYSEHNLMIQPNNGKIFTMDVSQSVEYNTKTFINTGTRIRIDRAMSMLETDINNINQYFKRIYHIGVDPNEILLNLKEELPIKLQDFLNERTMEIYPGELIPSESFSGKSQYRNRVVEERTGSMRQTPK